MHLETDDPGVFEVLGLIAQRARHENPAQAHTRLTVLRHRKGRFRILDGGDLLAEALTPEEVLDCVFARVYRRATELASLKGWLRVHGASFRFGEHQAVVVGPASAGKSTLALGLLSIGAEVAEDESFVTCEDQVFGVARRFHVQPESVELLHGCRWLLDAPALGPSPLRLVDPTEHGFDWRISSGPVEHVVVLRRTRGPSRLEPLQTSMVVQEIISQVFPVLEPRRAIVRQASVLASSAHGHLLHAGPDLEAPAILMNLVHANGKP